MKRPLRVLIAAAIGVRLVSALTMVVVAQDGARNLRMSRLMLEGRWHDALTLYPVTHPFYPMLVAIGEALTGTPLFWACLISAVLGGLAVVPLFHLARNAWNERVATLSGLLYAFLPAAVELHGDAMLEGTFFCLFLTSMALAWSAVEDRSWPRAVLSGVAAAAAWLTRPEGAYLVPLILLAAALRPSRFSLAVPALALLPALALALPYQGFIREQTGRYGISASPFSAGILGLFTGETRPTEYEVTAKTTEEFRECADIEKYGRVGGPVVTVTKALLKNFFYVPAAFLLLGFCFPGAEDRKPRPWLYLMAAAVGYLLPALLAFIAGTPFSHRYILLTAVLLLPVAAVGMLQAASWVQVKVRDPRLPRWALIAFLAVMGLRDVRPRREDKLPLRLAGETIREKLGEDRKILSPSRQVEYYARGDYVELLPGATFEDVRQLVDQGRVDVVAIDLADLRNVEPGFRDRMDAAWPLLAEFTSSGHRKATPVRVWITRP
jgi:hypothetical protein